MFTVPTHYTFNRGRARFPLLMFNVQKHQMICYTSEVVNKEINKWRKTR